MLLFQHVDGPLDGSIPFLVFFIHIGKINAVEKLVWGLKPKLTHHCGQILFEVGSAN